MIGPEPASQLVQYCQRIRPGVHICPVRPSTEPMTDQSSAVHRHSQARSRPISKAISPGRPLPETGNAQWPHFSSQARSFPHTLTDLSGSSGESRQVRRRIICAEPVPETQPSSETQPESVPCSVPSSIPPSILLDQFAGWHRSRRSGQLGCMHWKDNSAESHPKVTWMGTQTSETSETDSNKLPHLIQIVD